MNDLTLTVNATAAPIALGTIGLRLAGQKGDKGDTGATGAQGIQGIQGATGNGISSVTLKSGNHAAGTTDTYTITFTSGATVDFTVYNGANGEIRVADIVNDLTTGGTTKPLSAEQGKTLKGLADTNAAAISTLNTKVIEKTSYGVYTGLGVTAQATPNMTVAVATGTIYMSNGDRFTPTANNALAVTAADATNPRVDIVYVNSSGVIAYLAGTAAASPSAPSVPTGGQKLAEISVAANQTTIQTANIADRRKNLYTEAWITPTLTNSWVNYSALGAETVGFYKDSLGVVRLRGAINGGTAGTNAFVLPAGYRPSATKYFICASSAVNAARVDISLAGVVAVSGFTTWLSLDSISFRAV